MCHGRGSSPADRRSRLPGKLNHTVHLPFRDGLILLHSK